MTGAERGSSQILESPFTVAGVALQHPHARRFSYKTQRVQLFFRGFLRWLVTAALIGAIFAVLKTYSSAEILDEKQKKTFNALITLFSITLGINLASSLRVLAQNLRWYLVSRGPRPLREFDLILGCESLVKVCQLFWEARGRPWVRVCCASWLLLNLVLQCAVSLLGLTYNIDSADNLLLLKSGNVSISDISHWYPPSFNSSKTPSILQEQYTANTYGFLTPSLTWDYNSSTSDDSVASSDLYEADDGLSWLYYYVGNNPSDSSVSAVQHRTIQLTWSCTGYPVISTNATSTTSPAVTYSNNSRAVTMPVKHTSSPGSMTYIVETNTTCGPRCAILYAYQAGLNDSDPASAITESFTECHITVSNIYDVTDPSYTYGSRELLPDEQARIAAGAIGFQGFVDPSDPDDTRQYHEYQSGSPWSPTPGQDSAEGGPLAPGDVGWWIGYFSIGALANMDSQNPHINISDPALETPYRGVTLAITSWPIVYLILFALLGAHAILFLGVVTLADRVIVRDSSELATARLLRGLVSKLGRGGCMLDGKGISEALKEDGNVIYGVWKGSGIMNGEVWHTDVRCAGWEGEGTGLGTGFVRAWPGGLYDGEAYDNSGCKEDEGNRRAKLKMD